MVGGVRLRLVVVAAVAIVGAALVVQSPAGGQLAPTCNGLLATIVGTEGRDNLIGTPGDDVIVGLAGSDRIVGRGGQDTICGGPGRDRIRGSNGRDTIFGEGGRDKIFGGGGADVIFGNGGNDRIFGGNGDDTLRGNRGTDFLYGNDGADTCVDQTTAVVECAGDGPATPPAPTPPWCSAAPSAGDREAATLMWDLGPGFAGSVIVRSGSPEGANLWMAELTGATSWSTSVFPGQQFFLRVRIDGERTDVRCPFPGGGGAPDPRDVSLGSCRATAAGSNRGDEVVIEWDLVDDLDFDNVALRFGYTLP